MKLWREGGRGGGLRKQRLTSERCGCWSQGQAGEAGSGQPCRLLGSKSFRFNGLSGRTDRNCPEWRKYFLPLEAREAESDLTTPGKTMWSACG